MKRLLKYISIATPLLVLFAVIMAPLAAASDTQAPCEHEFGEWVLTQAPTCAQKGEAVRTCTKCGSTESIAVVSPGHVSGEWVLEQAPQVGVAGSMYVACTLCGEVLQTEALPPLQAPETESEAETAPAPDTTAPAPALPTEQDGWIEITLPVAIALCLAPNLILIVVLVIHNVRRRHRK